MKNLNDELLPYLFTDILRQTRIQLDKSIGSKILVQFNNRPGIQLRIQIRSQLKTNTKL